MPLLHEPLHHFIEFSCLVRHIEAEGRLSEYFNLLLNFEDGTQLFMKSRGPSTKRNSQSSMICSVNTRLSQTKRPYFKYLKLNQI